MPAVTLKGHKCSGHGCWPARASDEGESRFTVNNDPLHLQGHAWKFHTCTKEPYEEHKSELKSGSERFTVNKKQVGRVGDPVKCGSTVAEGYDRFNVEGG